MKRKSQAEIGLEKKLDELYKTLADTPSVDKFNAYPVSHESLQVQIEQVKFELSRFDAQRDALRVSTREWANFALTVLSVAAAILIAIFKKGV